MSNKILEEGIRVLRIESEAISGLIKRLDHRFVDAVNLCFSCQGHIVVIGMGKSGLIGKKISATFASTGTPAFFMHPSEGIHGDLGMISKNDLALTISNSGETEEILRILPSLKRIGLKLITLTGKVKSTLALHSEVVLDVSVSEEACSLGLAPTASTTATLAMGDALAVALLEKRGFRKEDFASFHPGGSLGRNLLLKVEDIMHQGVAIPKVRENTPMHEVILEMTAKKLGMTTVVDDTNTLIGVITDGDLRRFFESANHKSTNLFSLPAKTAMSLNPKTIRKDALAAEAVHLMENTAITVLISVDASGNVLGILHMHDLIKKGAL